jgi:hypothetical protein
MEPSHQSEGQAPKALTPEQQHEVKLARLCFQKLERLTMQMLSYPPGHPAIETALKATRDAFYDFYQTTDRMSLQVYPHELRLFGTDAEVWETDEPRDYCFVMSRDGIYLIHLLAGLDEAEIKRLVDVLNALIERRNDPKMDAVQLFFDASFRYISYEALDESLAALANIDLDMRNRDTPEEKGRIEELFSQAFKAEEGQDTDAVGGDFEIRISNPMERMRKIEVGSRQFLELDPDVQQRLADLKRGFLEHRELEHREGEILSAILGAQPREHVRVQAVKQIGEVMNVLLGTDEPWEALTFLKIIHAWRDRFAPEVAQELKDVVAACFGRRRILELVRQIARADKQRRRAILQMFNALHLEDASAELVRALAWDLAEEAREDIVRYLRERVRFGHAFLEESIAEVPAEHVGPLLEIVSAGMPATRPIALKLLSSAQEPALKARALGILDGTWSSPIEIRDVLVPLVSAAHSETRLAAARSLCKAAPQHVVRVFSPLFSDELRKRPEDEVRELAMLFVKHGGKEATAKLQELIQRRGLTTSEAERELAVTVTRALIRTPHPAIIDMLDEVAKDWLVPQRIRSTCKEVADLLRTGMGK